jgi:hypothetical protein
VSPHAQQRADGWYVEIGVHPSPYEARPRSIATGTGLLTMSRTGE